MNNKVVSNIYVDPRNTIKLAETEATLQREAHTSLTLQNSQNRATESSLPQRHGRWCFTDGLWKDHANFSEQGWYNTLEEFDGLMETRNTRPSLTPLHAEIEALIWAMERRV